MARTPKVTETDYTSDTEGPDMDSSSMTQETPPGHQRDDDQQYVIDDTDKKATPPGMLSRDVIARDGHAAMDAPSETSDIKMMVAAGIAFVFVLILGLIGVVYSMSGGEIEKIEQQVAAEHGTEQAPPEEVQGVKVRKGMKHTPTAAPKRSDLQTDDPADAPEGLPDNAVPDGSAPADPADPAASNDPPQ